MDEPNLKTLEQIPIPEGLEERLSAKIDEWEREEKKPRRRISVLRYVAAAACFALVRGCRCLLRPCLWRGVSSDEQK